nr:MAG TPA: hypothetical protein [Bacteriophage sp.]DAF14467.1 MAG TPA: hypothetical protein [Crassvirales sp.]
MNIESYLTGSSKKFGLVAIVNIFFNSVTG